MHTLADLHQEHGEELEKIIDYAFADFFPRDRWMKGKPLTWGTVMHCLPDAIAAWTPPRTGPDPQMFYSWDCGKCGRENMEQVTEIDGKLGLLCGDCGTLEPWRE